MQYNVDGNSITQRCLWMAELAMSRAGNDQNGDLFIKRIKKKRELLTVKKK